MVHQVIVKGELVGGGGLGRGCLGCNNSCRSFGAEKLDLGRAGHHAGGLSHVGMVAWWWWAKSL